MAIGGPDFQLRIARRAELQQEVFAPVAQLEPRDHLRVAAVEALGHAEDRRKQAHRAPEIARQIRVLLLRLLRDASAMVERHERHDLDLLRVESAQVAVLDQILRMFVVPRVADVHADVVHQRRVFEPLALAVGAAVHGARLVEERQRQARHLPGVLGEVVAALGQLDRAAPADIGNAIDLCDLAPVPADVVEHEAFAEREVAERQILGAQPPEDCVDEHRASHHEIGAPGIQLRNREPFFEVELDDVLA